MLDWTVSDYLPTNLSFWLVIGVIAYPRVMTYHPVARYNTTKSRKVKRMNQHRWEEKWVANVIIERLWRSLKYEEVYLKAYDSVRSAEEGIGN